MAAKKVFDPVELAFQQVKPIHDALKKAARLAKREHEIRRRLRTRNNQTAHPSEHGLDRS